MRILDLGRQEGGHPIGVCWAVKFLDASLRWDGTADILLRYERTGGI
jgi:hypothetical protein